MKIKDIAVEIEKIAPSGLALDWDNVGMLVGDASGEVKNILMAIDITAGVVAEAKKSGTDLIVSYHPVIWDGLKKVTADGEGSVVYELIKAGIGVYSIHTALDIAAGGVNDALAQMVGIVDAKPIGDFVENPEPGNYKLVVFVPADDAQKVAEAIFKAGAGHIGNYSKCGFTSQGVGSFLPLEGSNPTIGKKKKLQKVKELRFEAIVNADKIAGAIEAMRKAHPYEMPAFDVIKLDDPESRFGLGRVGKLAKAEPLSAILARIKKGTGAAVAGIVGKEKRTVKSAAVCAGSCGKIINTVIERRCDLYITGELKHHHALAAAEAGLTCVCLSHTVSERFILKKLTKNLQKRLKSVKIKISRQDKDPFNWKSI